MKLKIQAFKKKDMPSNFGNGTWSVIDVKFEGIENPEYGYSIKGFSKGITDKLQNGQVLTGYFDTEHYTKKDGSPGSKKVFKAITPEYVYDLLLKRFPDIETGQAVQTTQSFAAMTPAHVSDTDPNYQEPIIGPDDEVTSPGW